VSDRLELHLLDVELAEGLQGKGSRSEKEVDPHKKKQSMIVVRRISKKMLEDTSGTDEYRAGSLALTCNSIKANQTHGRNQAEIIAWLAFDGRWRLALAGPRRTPIFLKAARNKIFNLLPRNAAVV